MIDILRNMTRRKTRTGLTVLGIVIGVLALTIMGAMAEEHPAQYDRLPGLADERQRDHRWRGYGPAARQPAGRTAGALDSKLSEQVITLMRRLNEETGQTVVIVTHDPEVAARTARTVYLDDGRVARDEERMRATGALGRAS